MLEILFHAWERRLASVTKDRTVRPFDWGLDWVPPNGHRGAVAPDQQPGDWVAHVMSDTDAFFTPEPTTDYRVRPAAADAERLLSFPSALHTPHATNNTVHARLFQARGRSRRRAA